MYNFGKSHATSNNDRQSVSNQKYNYVSDKIKNMGEREGPSRKEDIIVGPL